MGAGFSFESFSQPTRPQLQTACTLGAIAVGIQTMQQHYYFSSMDAASSWVKQPFSCWSSWRGVWDWSVLVVVVVVGGGGGDDDDMILYMI